MTATMLALYAVILADLAVLLREHGLDVNVGELVGARPLIVVTIATAIAFVVSSIIIDNVLNPLRQMIAKVREIGEMNFGNPLIIDADDDELREYAFAFNTMAAKLNRYIELQKRFVSDASHELATPITIINGHADLLLRHGVEKSETSLVTIKQEVGRMNVLIDGLLLLARSDSGAQAYRFERTNIGTLIKEVVDESRLSAPKFSFESEISPELFTNCDADAIRRVVRIILSNACKYGDNRIKITARENGGLVQISVWDNGIGISAEDLPRIFERFYRADASRSRNTGGSGLGLAIAREIIAAHGGEFDAESTPGEGTTVSFSIPS